MDGFAEAIFREIALITRWIYQILVRPMTTVTLIILILYYGYTQMICHHACTLPFVCRFCPTEKLESLSLPPLSKQAENSASLVDALVNTDVSAPMRCVKAKIALIELRAQIMHSDIDRNVRENLGEQMQELQKLIETGADQLTTMLASFGGAIDKLKIYTQFLLDDLSRVTSPKTSSSGQLQIGYSEMEATDILIESYNEHIELLNDQVNKILFKAEQAQMSLKQISHKFETIQDLNYKGKKISQSRLDELQHGSYWSWLFDEGQLGIVKHQRNLGTLDKFIYFIRTASENIDDIIIKLKLHERDATDLKETTAGLDSSRRKSLETEGLIIKAAVKRLTQSKETFERKIEQANQEKNTL